MASLTYTEESFTDVMPEIMTLTHEHWEEVTDHPEVELDVAWDSFLAMDRLKLLRVMVCRHEGALVGYIVFIICPALHYQSQLFAHDDAFFLKKEHRKGTAGIRIFNEAEKMLKAHGVDRILYHEKNRVPMGGVFKYLGYHPQETIWAKTI